MPKLCIAIDETDAQCNKNVHTDSGLYCIGHLFYVPKKMVSSKIKITQKTDITTDDILFCDKSGIFVQLVMFLRAAYLLTAYSYCLTVCVIDSLPDLADSYSGNMILSVGK